MTQLFGSYTIHADYYELSANIGFDKDNRFYSPMLEFLERKSEQYPKQNLLWDNDEYLLIVKDILKKVIDKEILSGLEQKELFEIEEYIPRKDFPTIVEMLERAIELGFFIEYFKSKEDEVKV